ncbi:DUF6527 family protein [Ancylobacter vacuolatus]|uniref:DUF6527 family protein n=1 Tax=Ancylobacter vacuolatus TaxID=223389 RepID=UPI003643E56C
MKFDLLAETASTFPADAGLAQGRLVVVRDGDVEKWACLACPGGCGRTINLSLNPVRRPRWSVVTDFWSRPTLLPSVHQLNECGCHFWIKDGCIDWCQGGRPTDNSSKQGRH